MSDEEFGQAVENANGRVSIGFKDAGAVEGVDATGRSLMSRESASAAVASLVAQGAKVRYQFQRQPAVLVTIDREMAVRLRKDANVDYVEPESFMKLASQVTPWGVTATGATSAYFTGKDCLVPTPLAGNIKSKTVGGCLVNMEGIMFCYGIGERGGFATVPTKVATEIRFVDIAGVTNTCALTAEDDAWCWGPNEYGINGPTATSAIALVPVKVEFPPL